MVISLLVTSPTVKGSGNNRYNCFLHRIAWPDLSNRRWQRFTSILSISEWGCNAHVKTVMLIVQSAQDEIICNLVLPVLLMDEISSS